MAFALSLALFGYFWVVGYAAVAALHTQRDGVRNALIAPAVGVALTIYCVYLFSRLGLPVKTFAYPLTVVAVVLAAIALLHLRPRLPVRSLCPYVLIALLAFGATGWPLLTGGFAWVGDLNPDMLNYVFDAHRLVDQAFLQQPDREVWANQSDWSGLYGLYASSGVRMGAQLLLAWTIALTGKSGVMIYMPLLASLHVVLLAAATALISRPDRYTRVVAALLLSCSAMLTLGVVLQLIAQVLGLLLLVLSCVLCLSPFYRLGQNAFARFTALAGVVMAAFVLSYPETLPFFGLAFLIHHGPGIRENRRFVRPVLKGVVIIGVFASVLVAPEVLSLPKFLYGQISSGTLNGLPNLFPYFLAPAGLAALWGLAPYSAAGGELIATDFAIAAVLSVITIAATLWLVWRREPAAAVTLVMIILAVPLIGGGSGFAVFKLAMYIQPFLLLTLILGLSFVFRVGR
jgi:hypothetical protein